MMSTGLIIFCLLYICLMSILQIDGLSFWAIIASFVLSYHLTPVVTKWIMSNKNRSRDDWFKFFYER